MQSPWFVQLRQSHLNHFLCLLPAIIPFEPVSSTFGTSYFCLAWRKIRRKTKQAEHRQEENDWKYCYTNLSVQGYWSEFLSLYLLNVIIIIIIIIIIMTIYYSSFVLSSFWFAFRFSLCGQTCTGEPGCQEVVWWKNSPYSTSRAWLDALTARLMYDLASPFHTCMHTLIQYACMYMPTHCLHLCKACMNMKTKSCMVKN